MADDRMAYTKVRYHERKVDRIGDAHRLFINLQADRFTG